jgi:hypothetical protein
MIASILRIPADTPADPDLRERIAATPGLVHFYILVPGEGIGDRLAVLFWATEQDLDAYIESDLGQQVLRDNPQATRTVYTVTQVK